MVWRDTGASARATARAAARRRPPGGGRSGAQRLAKPSANAENWAHCRHTPAEEGRVGNRPCCNPL